MDHQCFFATNKIVFSSKLFASLAINDPYFNDIKLSLKLDTLSKFVKSHILFVCELVNIMDVKAKKVYECINIIKS